MIVNLARIGHHEMMTAKNCLVNYLVLIRQFHSTASHSYHFLWSWWLLCVTDSNSHPQPVPGVKRPKWRTSGIHLKFLLSDQMFHIKTLDLNASFPHDIDTQFLCKVLPVAIINGFLSHHFFRSNLNIARNSKNEPHTLHDKITQCCNATDDNGNHMFTQCCPIYDNCYGSNRYIRHGASMNSTTFERWNDFLPKCYRWWHAMVLI